MEQLLAESDALHAWLARLDAVPVTATDAVRERVRRDYQVRLDQLTAGLRAHADVIEAKLRDDRREHDELQSRANAARDALAEAELRHAVGEYDAQRFESERTRHSSDIESFDLSLGAIGERIARLVSVHGLVSRGPRPPVVEPAAAPVEHRAPEPEPKPEPEPEPPQIHVIGEVEQELIAIADLAPDADPDEVLAIFNEPEGAVRKPETGPLSFRPSGSATPARSFESAPPLGIPAADQPPRFVRPGDRIRPAPPPPPTIPPVMEQPPPAPAAELFGEEIVASGPAVESPTVPVARTLRCGECGAMNKPLEWYCEKCGAELTAV